MRHCPRTLLQMAGSLVLCTVLALAGASTGTALADDVGVPSAAALRRAQFGVEDRGPSFNDAAYFKCTATTAQCNITCLDAGACDYGEHFGYEAFTDPVTGRERRAVALEKTNIDGAPATVWGCDCSGLRPGTSYDVEFYSVYIFDGAVVKAAAECIGFSTVGMSAPSASAVKLAASKVSLAVAVPAHMRAKGAFKMAVYAGAKKIKTLTTTGAAEQRFTYKKKGAAKKKYKVVCTWAGDSKLVKTSAAAKPKANKATFKQDTDAYSYDYGTLTAKPLRIAYNAKGRLVAKALWVNASLAKLTGRFKAKVTVKVDGKKVAVQTFDSGKVGRMTTKRKTLVFKKAKKGRDLVNGKVSWSVKVVKKG